MGPAKFLVLFYRYFNTMSRCGACGAVYLGEHICADKRVPAFAGSVTKVLRKPVTKVVTEKPAPRTFVTKMGRPRLGAEVMSTAERMRRMREKRRGK